MMLSVNLYAKERRGAKLLITKKDGQLIAGELIVVKPTSLLLLNTVGKDVAVDIADIKLIRIVKKSKALLGGGIGLVICIGGAGLIGALVGEGPLEKMSGLAFGYVEFGMFYGPVAALLGAIIGAIAGTDETIQIEGMTDSEIQETLDYLCKKARVINYK